MECAAIQQNVGGNSADPAGNQKKSDDPEEHDRQIQPDQDVRGRLATRAANHLQFIIPITEFRINFPERQNRSRESTPESDVRGPSGPRVGRAKKCRIVGFEFRKRGPCELPAVDAPAARCCQKRICTEMGHHRTESETQDAAGGR